MKSFNIILVVFLFGILMLLPGETYSQNRFKAGIAAGMTASQLGGDSLSGYDKLGFSFGARLSYGVGKKYDLTMELLYSQRGSRESVGFSNSGPQSTSLNYLEIPVYFTINDWLIESGNYYKVGLFGGLTYAYLISVNTSNPILSGRESEFQDHDIAARVGVYYAFTKNITFRTYYTDSFVKLIEGDLFNTDGLDSFFWTFRLEYNF